MKEQTKDYKEIVGSLETYIKNRLETARDWRQREVTRELLGLQNFLKELLK